MPPIEVVLTDELDVRGRAVEHQAAPVVVYEQETRVRFEIVLDAEFDELLLGDPGLRDEMLNDPIVTELGKHLELRGPETPDPASAPGGTQQSLAGQDLQIAELTADRRELGASAEAVPGGEQPTTQG